MNTLAMSQSETHAAKPWWKEPYVWMVIGGPLLVVLAAIYTAVIAFRNPPTLVDRTASRPTSIVVAPGLAASEAETAALAKLEPAHQARNHAASPVVPKLVPAEK